MWTSSSELVNLCKGWIKLIQIADFFSLGIKRTTSFHQLQPTLFSSQPTSLWHTRKVLSVCNVATSPILVWLETYWIISESLRFLCCHASFNCYLLSYDCCHLINEPRSSAKQILGLILYTKKRGHIPVSDWELSFSARNVRYKRCSLEILENFT